MDWEIKNIEKPDINNNYGNNSNDKFSFKGMVEDISDWIDSIDDSIDKCDNYDEQWNRMVEKLNELDHKYKSIFLDSDLPDGMIGILDTREDNGEWYYELKEIQYSNIEYESTSSGFSKIYKDEHGDLLKRIDYDDKTGEYSVIYNSGAPKINGPFYVISGDDPPALLSWTNNDSVNQNFLYRKSETENEEENKFLSKLEEIKDNIGEGYDSIIDGIKNLVDPLDDSIDEYRVRDDYVAIMNTVPYDMRKYFNFDSDTDEYTFGLNGENLHYTNREIKKTDGKWEIQYYNNESDTPIKTVYIDPDNHDIFAEFDLKDTHNDILGGDIKSGSAKVSSYGEVEIKKCIFEDNNINNNNQTRAGDPIPDDCSYDITTGNFIKYFTESR